MPTFFDSTADAAEASEALRGLAHASRGFDQPAEMYGVIGDLSSGMRSLRQVLDQIADVHERKAALAFNDDGNHEAGVRDALAAAEELRQAAAIARAARFLNSGCCRSRSSSGLLTKATSIRIEGISVLRKTDRFCSFTPRLFLPSS